MTLFNSKPRSYMSRSIEEFNQKSGSKIGGLINTSKNNELIKKYSDNKYTKNENYEDHSIIYKIFPRRKLIENVSNF